MVLFTKDAVLNWLLYIINIEWNSTLAARPEQNLTILSPPNLWERALPGFLKLIGPTTVKFSQCTDRCCNVETRGSFYFVNFMTHQALSEQKNLIFFHKKYHKISPHHKWYLSSLISLSKLKKICIFLHFLTILSLILSLIPIALLALFDAILKMSSEASACGISGNFPPRPGRDAFGRRQLHELRFWDAGNEPQVRHAHSWSKRDTWKTKVTCWASNT